MKVRLEFEGELFEDRDDFKMLAHAYDLMSSIHEAKEKIRSRLKYGEDVSDQEEKILEEIRECLYVEGLDI